ncbi:MAG: insulinase family protein [Bacteroidota bacterium]
MSQITIYTVAKHFESILPILAAVMEAPLFTASELELYSNNSKQRLMVDLSKNDVIAYRTLTEQIFGSNHPYGYNSNDQAFDDLVQKDLQDHFKKCYQSGNGFVLLSGKVGDREIKLLDGYLSNVIPKGKRLEAKIQAEATPPQSIRIEKKNSVQTAIRMGKKLFNRQHEDYPAMYMVNMALGGYFGSRLMSNIREKQGYTYNIYSSLDPMLFDGSFIISTEVGNDFVDNTRKEIHAEIDTLIGEKMPAAELEMLRNYTMGYLLTLLDGTFNQSDWIKMIKSHDIEYEYFNRLVDTVKFIDAEGIRSMAEKYLQPDEFSEVVVGP